MANEDHLEAALHGYLGSTLLPSLNRASAVLRDLVHEPGEADFDAAIQALNKEIEAAKRAGMGDLDEVHAAERLLEQKVCARA